jgi:hypothetical protein
MPDDLQSIKADLKSTMSRVAVLEKHVIQLKADQQSLAKLMVTKSDMANATDRISKKIDSSTGTIVSAVVTAMRGLR